MGKPAHLHLKQRHLCTQKVGNDDSFGELTLTYLPVRAAAAPCSCKGELKKA